MNKNHPLVSVCMITYNHEMYIAQAIESVLMQKTNFDYEIVIGEDCSTDRTREIVLGYKAKHPDKIKLLLQEKNVGMMQNFIDTLKACTGKYIALLEGDDYWTDPYKLQMQVDILEKHPEYSMCFTARNIVDELNKINYVEKYSKEFYTTKDVIGGFIAGVQTIVFRKFKDLISFLDKNRNFLAGDRLLTYYFSILGRLYCLNKITATYRISSVGIWSKRDIESKRVMAFENLCNFFEIIGLTVKDSRLAYWGAIYFLNNIRENLDKPLYVIKRLSSWYNIYLSNFNPVKNLIYLIKVLLKKMISLDKGESVEKTSY